MANFNITNPTQFAQTLLQTLGAPVTQQNVGDIVSWANAEGGNWNNNATYNPLNTSLPEPGSVNVGGGIQAYDNWQQGIYATATTLTSSNPQYGYGAILNVLAKGNAPYTDFQSAVVNSSWDGSGHYQGTAFGSGSQLTNTATGGSIVNSNLDAAVSQAQNDQPKDGVGKVLLELDGFLNPNINPLSMVESLGLSGVGALVEMVAMRALFGLLGIGVMAAGIYVILGRVGGPLGIIGVLQNSQRISQSNRRLDIQQQEADTRRMRVTAQPEMELVA